MFYQDKQTREAFLQWMKDHPLLSDILYYSIGYIAALAICAIITIMLEGCKRTVEDTTTTTNIEIQRDTTHSVLDTYDRVEVNDSWQYGTWYNFDSLLAHIRIIDFDTLGRPVRYVDADVQHGAAKGGSTTAKAKDSAKVSQTHADTISASAAISEHKEQSRVVKQPLPWWQRTSFRIAAAIIAAIIAIIIAYLTRHRWKNRILMWLLHIK